MAAAAAVQAAAIVLAQAKADFNHVLDDVCRLTQWQRQADIDR